MCVFCLHLYMCFIPTRFSGIFIIKKTSKQTISFDIPTCIPILYKSLNISFALSISHMRQSSYNLQQPASRSFCNLKAGFSSFLCFRIFSARLVHQAALLTYAYYYLFAIAKIISNVYSVSIYDNDSYTKKKQ